MKKFICTICGYVHEGDEAPEFCPQCKQPKSKFKELVETEGALTFVDEHRLGVAKGVDPEVLESTFQWRMFRSRDVFGHEPPGRS